MTSYWFSDRCSLLNSFNINPFTGEDKNYKYNSLTRLIIFTTLLFILLYPKFRIEIFLTGCVSIFLSIIIYINTFNKTVI